MTVKPNSVISTQQVYQGKLIAVRVEQVRQDDGRTTTREIVEHKPAAVIIPYLERSDEVIFIEQYRDAVREAILELPAGMIGTDASLEETARRELLEETGFEAGALQHLGGYFTSPGFTNERHELYLATKLTQISGIQDTNEISTIKRLRREEAVHMIQAGTITDGKTVLGLLWAEHYLPHKGSFRIWRRASNAR
jgi:ADP-ribose pyrophosphatase